MAGKSFLSQFQILKEHRVWDTNRVLGGGVGEVRGGGVGEAADVTADVQGEVANIAEVEEEVSLQVDMIRDEVELQVQRG